MSYFEDDARDYLPSDFIEKVEELVPLADHVKREGAGPGSLTEEGLEYYVVDGVKLLQHAPWLWDFYAGPGLQMARDLLGIEVRCSDHIQSAVNVNVIKGKGGSYEWHTDQEPFTALLFASRMTSEDGGALVLSQDQEEVHLYPMPGRFIIFDGSAVPHAVEELRRNLVRLSIPLVYLSPEAVGRVKGIDAFLYADPGISLEGAAGESRLPAQVG